MYIVNTPSPFGLISGAGLTCWWCGFSNTNTTRRVAGGGALTCWWCGFSNTNTTRRVAGGGGLTCWWCGFPTQTHVEGLSCVCVVTYMPHHKNLLRPLNMFKLEPSKCCIVASCVTFFDHVVTWTVVEIDTTKAKTEAGQPSVLSRIDNLSILALVTITTEYIHPQLCDGQ